MMRILWIEIYNAAAHTASPLWFGFPRSRAMIAPDLTHVDWDHLPPNETIQARAIATMAVSFPLVVLTLGARLYSRFRIVKTAGWDDWTMVVATVGTPPC